MSLTTRVFSYGRPGQGECGSNVYVSRSYPLLDQQRPAGKKISLYRYLSPFSVVLQ